MTKYKDLQALLDGDAAAKAFFDSLPPYVRDFCTTYSGQINSLDSLHSHIENATRGDG